MHLHDGCLEKWFSLLVEIKHNGRKVLRGRREKGF